MSRRSKKRAKKALEFSETDLVPARSETDHAGTFIVVSLDVLGQGEAFDRLEVALAKDPIDLAGVNRAALEVLNPIAGLRGLLNAAHKSVSKDYFSRGKSRMPRWGSMGFADTVVLWLRVTDKDLRIRELGHILACVTHVMRECVRNRILVRGGIDVGLGHRIFGGQIYGLAYFSAYKLGERQAVVPRILVGDTVVKLLEKGSESGKIDEAEQAAQMLAIDARDGLTIVDYLDTSAVPIHPQIRDDVKARANDWLDIEASRFRQQANAVSGAHQQSLVRVAEKYEYVADYVRQKTQ